MVHPFLLGSTLLKTQRSILPRTFYRYKSITAAIERGRQGGPDRPSRPQSRTSYADAGDRPEKTRFEQRLERFGPPDNAGKKEFARTRSREDQPRRDGSENVTARRSSRFGRVGPPRPRDDAPSRFREERPSPRDRDERPQRRENAFGAAPERAVNRGRRFEEEERLSSDRYGRGRDLAADRPPHRDQFETQDERPPRRERPLDNRDTRTFRDERSSRFDKSRSFDNDGNSRFNKPRTSHSDRYASRESPTERLGDRGEPRTEKANRTFSNDDASPYTRPPREAYDGRSKESRFPHADSKGARRERSRTGAFERSYTHESSYKQADPPSGTTSDTTTLRTTVRDIESLPYTTAASEFIYGHSSVLAAIKAQRRKFYNLYVHPRGASRDNLLARIRALKLFPITKEVGDDYIRAMDKASNGRPHNGVVLESSPLPVPPITELKTTSLEDDSFSVTLDTQSAEDALVNGKQENYPYRAAGWRHPLVLYVDGVLDEGNLGAIARSAYFLGVDAIVTPTRQSAPWSHIALKASAGAAEAIPIFKVGEPTDFLGKSSRAGWRIYASSGVTPEHSTSAPTSEPATTAESSKIVYTVARSSKRLPANHSPVAEHPTILMMGAESTGLRIGLLNLAHYNVGIQHVRDVDEIGVDSLNVSAAASILCYEMLQKPKLKATPTTPEDALF